MNPIQIGLIVEGHGDASAMPVLFRRIAAEIDAGRTVEIAPPMRRPRSSLVHKPRELERAVEFVALRVRPRGGIFVLVDGDDDCPAKLGPSLQERAKPNAMGLPVSVILPVREFECWLLAAAQSLRGKRGLPADLEAPTQPEQVRGAKEWLNERMSGHSYSETIDQAKLAAVFDLGQARAVRSFDKCYRAVQALFDHYRD